MKISKPASRIFALLLAVFMVFGMLPVSAFAAGETVTYKQVTTIEAGKQYILAVKSSDSGATSTSSYAVTASTDSDNQKLKTKVNFTGDINQNNATVALADSNDYSKVLWTATAVEGGIKLTNGSLAIGRNASGKGLVVSSNNTDSALFVHTVEDGKIYNADGNTKHYLGYGNVGTQKYSFGFAQSNTSSFTDKIRIFTAEDTSGGEGGNQGGGQDTDLEAKTASIITYKVEDYPTPPATSKAAVEIAVGQKLTVSVENGSSNPRDYTVTASSSNGGAVDGMPSNLSIQGKNTANKIGTFTVTGKTAGTVVITINNYSNQSTYKGEITVTVTGEGGSQGGGQGGTTTETKEISVETVGNEEQTVSATIAVGGKLNVKLTSGSGSSKNYAASVTSGSDVAEVSPATQSINGFGTGTFVVTGKKAGSAVIKITASSSSNTYTAIINLTVTGEGGQVTPPVDNGQPGNGTHLGFTSDVHDETTYLTNWLNTVQAAVKPDLEYMAYGGDYSYQSIQSAYKTTFDNIVSITNNLVGNGKGIYTSGNHEYFNATGTAQLDSHFTNTPGFTRIGLAKDGDEYDIYCLGASGWYSAGEFTDADIQALSTYLASAPKDEAIFIVAHFPLHSNGQRTIVNADKVIDLLNKYPNVIFLWGHNHSQTDNEYGQIRTDGDSITYASGKSKEINFTYASAGAMKGNKSPYYGLVAHISDDGETVTLKYYNTTGATNVSKVISIEAHEQHTHNYGTPSITWATNGQAATVSVTCSASGCPEATVTKNVNATVTGSTTGDCVTQATTTYTIPAGEIAGKSYASANKVITGDYGAHNYGTLVPAQAEVHKPTELKASVAAHYQCSVCEKYFTESKGETTLQALTGTVPTHSYGTAWTTDANQHWHACSCGAKKDAANHAYNATTHQCECGVQDPTYVPHVHNYGTPSITWAANGQTATVTVTCTASGCPEATVTKNVNATVTGSTTGDCVTQATTTYTIPAGEIAGKSYASANKVITGDYGAHNYGTLVPAQAEVHKPTELKASVAAHYQCSVCEKYFTESKGETTLQALTGTVPTHSYGTAWTTDANQHWHACSCGAKKDAANHAFTNGECVCGAEDPNYVPEAPVTKKYLIVSNGYAMTSREGEGYQNTGSNSSQKYNYTGFAGVEYNPNSRAAVTEDMLWTIEEVSGGYRIKQGDKILNASYGSNSTGGNDGKLMLSNTDDTWSRSGNLLKSKNADKFLTVGNPTSSNTSQTLFTVRSESNAKAVEFIEYSGSTPEPQPKTLQSIAVTTQPTKKAYTAGENFASAGMVVTATYSDGTSAAVTSYTVTDGNALTAGKTSVTISYTEGGVTKTTTVAITVTAATTPDEEEGNPTKVTALKPGKYVIANGSNALTSKVHSGYTNNSSYKYSGFEGKKVTISGNEITDATADMVFELATSGNGYTIKHVESGKYLNATYTQNSNNSGWTGVLTLDNTADIWTWDASTGYLRSTNASNSSKGLYLVFDDVNNNVSSGNQTNMFGIRSDSNNGNNLDKIDFYLVGKALEDDDDNQGGNEGGNQGGNEGGEVTDEPTKVTSLKAGQYVIANGSNALTSKVHSGYTNSSSYAYSGFEGKKVTISGNKITDATADMVFELATSGSGYTIKHVSSGKYLNATYTQNSNNNGWTGTLTLSATQDVWTWDASTGYLKSTNASNSSKGLYLVFDDVNNNVQSGNQTNMFGIRSDSNNGDNLDKIDFYLVGKALEDDDDNQGGGNQGGTVTNPEGTVFVAFSSDVHSQTTSTTSGSPARLNSWINTISGVVGGTFDTMAFCGDSADGTGNANGDAYWDRVAAVMSVVSNNNKVNGDGIFINGNHEQSNGNVSSSNHAAAKKIKAIGYTAETSDYVIYVFGAASSNQSYNTSDITALGNWLKTAPTNKPIFIISHFPIHSAANRTTGNADTLRTTLNEYADDHDIYFLWGHNHTNANSGENHYDKVYTGTLDNQTIKFTYLAAGCMSDSEYSTGSQSVKGKGLVAKIVDGKVETLTYYGESGNVVGTPYEVPDDSADPDQPVDPDQPDDPIVPDEPGKVTTLEDGYYIIVSNNNTKALTNTANSGYSNSNGYSYTGFNGADVTISGDKITKGATESMVFEIKAVTGGYTIKNVEKNQYLTATYTQASSGSGYDGKLFLSNTAEVWELDSNFRLKSTNASQNGRNLGLYLTYDDKADSLSSGAANFFGIRSEGQNSDFANVDKIDFYKVEVEDEPEPDQPEQPDHEHAWGDVTYTFAANGASCTATRACTGCETTETATATITSAVKTAATCETMGTTTYTATFTEDWAETQTKDVQDIPVIAHVFENGECTNCGTEDPAEADLFELYGANMLLGNNLAMNFYIEPADLEFGEDYYAVITKTYADREDLEIIIEDDEWEEAYNMYRVSLDKIAAKEMADEITVVIYNDEDEQVSKTWVDSVRDYTMRVLVKEEAKTTSDKELLALYVEMLNYGAAAQDHFNYNEDDLANNELTAAQQAYGLGTVEMEDFRVEGTGYVGTSLTLESNILMNFFFNNIPAEHDDMYAIATYTDHYGEAKQVKVEGENFVKHNSTIWKVSVSGLVVADCRELVSVKVYEADGDVIASVTDSIESYTARMDGDGPLYVAIMNFAVAAYNTFH